MRHSLRPALSLCQKNLYMLLHCPIGGTPDGCISASSYIKDRDWTRPSSSKFLLLTIGRALLRAFPICSQLDASSFEHFPLACNSWHPIAFFCFGSCCGAPSAGSPSNPRIFTSL